jgi:hypothetical protein
MILPFREGKVARRVGGVLVQVIDVRAKATEKRI